MGFASVRFEPSRAPSVRPGRPPLSSSALNHGHQKAPPPLRWGTIGKREQVGAETEGKLLGLPERSARPAAKSYRHEYAMITLGEHLRLTDSAP